ncbi:23S rRNA (uracil(747)-C(5))-methyltransferase RlmC [Xanthomonadaceae bacterium XH05]|nr:23S rRNA (uracil(747)-C(5))-methyltransferase RlmC [Xanthomonadaceae bacterium XH05]
MRCEAFEQGRCASCSLIGQPYAQQLADKQTHARELLAPFGEVHWLDPVWSRESGFRNKAKMVVGGSIASPTLGILDARGHGVDLVDCGLYPTAITMAFPAVARFITTAHIAPYDVPARRGELKHVLLTLAEHSGELMLRLVLRSQEPLARIRKHLPTLLNELPALRVVSVNLQPEHKAVLEGAQEILLTGETLTMQLNSMPIHLRPQSFFQTHTEVAAALYRQARDWVEAIDPPAMWDLYCGVGGFALHCADGRREVTGIELSAEAIASACRSRDELGLGHLHFHAADATAYAQAARTLPPLVLVNPPRRGIGTALCQRLRESQVRHIVYSSCNAISLARDIAELADFTLCEARLFDMFPQTAHYEVACLLERRQDPPRLSDG